MLFRGIKIEVSCAAWEQVKTLGDFWDAVSAKVDREKLVGLGYGWENNYFYYAIGQIDNFENLEEIKNVQIKNGEYLEIDLPDEGWKTKTGRASNLQKIYEDDFDCYNVKFKYEIEKFDSEGNCEISVLV
ncbi:MAG: hypothetical protein LBG64_02755 [Pseudomonadales bacterium]|jgi:hypothetical protein|nr:hypothetical protein [Pseudomonadales bacterium]